MARRIAFKDIRTVLSLMAPPRIRTKGRRLPGEPFRDAAVAWYPRMRTSRTERGGQTSWTELVAATRKLLSEQRKIVGRNREQRTASTVATPPGPERAGIADATFRTLRHTLVSHAIIRGVSLAELRELLGHSTMTMTLRYAHLAPTDLRWRRREARGTDGFCPPGKSATVSAQESAQSGTLDLAAGRKSAWRRPGGVAERLKAPVLKTGMGASPRGFESLPLRHPRARSGPLS